MKKNERIGFTLFILTLVFCFIMCITTGCDSKPIRADTVVMERGKSV